MPRPKKLSEQKEHFSAWLLKQHSPQSILRTLAGCHPRHCDQPPWLAKEDSAWTDVTQSHLSIFKASRILCMRNSDQNPAVDKYLVNNVSDHATRLLNMIDFIGVGDMWNYSLGVLQSLLGITLNDTSSHIETKEMSVKAIDSTILREVRNNIAADIKLYENLVNRIKTAYDHIVDSAGSVAHFRENCWHNCNQTAGPCEWCNTGICCRAGFADNGCKKTDGCYKAHCCVSSH